MKQTRMSTAAVNLQADALAAEAANGYLRWYDGTQPADSDDPVTTQTLLCEHRFGTPAFGAAVDGVIVATPIAGAAAVAGGAGTWFRVLKADGTTVLWDGSLAADDANATANSLVFAAGITVNIDHFEHRVYKAVSGL